MFSRWRSDKSIAAKVQAAVKVAFPDAQFVDTGDGSFKMTIPGATPSFVGLFAPSKGLVYMSLALDLTGPSAGRICEVVAKIARFKHSEALCIADDEGRILYNEEAVAHFVRRGMGVTGKRLQKYVH
jgi:hypothetical protein